MFRPGDDVQISQFASQLGATVRPSRQQTYNITYQTFWKTCFLFLFFFLKPGMEYTPRTQQKSHQSHITSRTLWVSWCSTLSETNISPETQCLEDDISFLEWPIFRGFVSFREGFISKILCFFSLQIAAQVTMLHLLFRFGASTSVLEACAQELDSAVTQHRHLAWNWNWNLLEVR